MTGTNQTSFVFAALVAAFFFWVTIRGDLPRWLGLLGLASGGGAGAGGGASGGAASGLPALPGLSPPSGPTLTPEQWSQTPSGRAGLSPEQMAAPSNAFRDFFTRYLFGN